MVCFCAILVLSQRYHCTMPVLSLHYPPVILPLSQRYPSTIAAPCLHYPSAIIPLFKRFLCTILVLDISLCQWTILALMHFCCPATYLYSVTVRFNLIFVHFVCVSFSYTYFTFEHTPSYQAIQFRFWDAVESMDPSNISVRNENFIFFIDKLIATSHFLKCLDFKNHLRIINKRCFLCLHLLKKAVLRNI